MLSLWEQGATLDYLAGLSAVPYRQIVDGKHKM
jgi:hypothetical protein